MAYSHSVTNRGNSVEVSELSFLRRPASQGRHKGHERFVFTIPPELARFLDPERVYQITVRRAGTVGRGVPRA